LGPRADDRESLCSERLLPLPEEALPIYDVRLVDDLG
jgi:hypothetical protein